MTSIKPYLIIAIAGILLTLLGGWMKIMHLPYAGLVFLMGRISAGLGLALLAWVLLDRQRKN